MMQQSRVLENEMRNYMTVSQRLHDATMVCGPDSPEAEMEADELEWMHENTEWPLLRRIIGKDLTRYLTEKANLVEIGQITAAITAAVLAIAVLCAADPKLCSTPQHAHFHVTGRAA